MLKVSQSRTESLFSAPYLTEYWVRLCRTRFLSRRLCLTFGSQACPCSSHDDFALFLQAAIQARHTNIGTRSLAVLQNGAYIDLQRQASVMFLLAYTSDGPRGQICHTTNLDFGSPSHLSHFMSTGLQLFPCCFGPRTWPVYRSFISRRDAYRLLLATILTLALFLRRPLFSPY